MPILLLFGAAGATVVFSSRRDIAHQVTHFQVGDEVYYSPQIFGEFGSYAQYHVAEESIVAVKPINLTHVEAACLPLAGGTAWDCLNVIFCTVATQTP